MNALFQTVASGLAVCWLAGFVWLAVVLVAAIAVRSRRSAARHWLCLVGILGLWGVGVGVWLAPELSWHPVVLNVLPAPTRVIGMEPLEHTQESPVVAPGAETPGRSESVSIVPADPETVPEPKRRHSEPIATRQPAPIEATAPAAAAERSSFWTVILASVWVGGVVVFGARLWNAHRAWRRLWDRAVAVESADVHAELNAAARLCGLDSVPDLRASDDVATAVVAGIRRPRILVPRSWLDRADVGGWGFALRHECAHVALAHLHWQVLENVTRVVWWPQPLVHLLGRVLAAAREDVCDNVVLGFDAAPDYADSLLALACLPTERVVAPAGVPLFGRRARLSHRIESLLDAGRDRRVWPSLRWRAVVGCLSVAFVLALVTVRWQATAKEPATEQAAKDQPPAAKHDESDDAIGKIRGTIVHADGKPAADVEVRLIKKRKDHYTLPLKPLRVRSDPQGQFAFDDLEPGSYRAYAFAGSETTRSRSFKFNNVVLNKQGRQEQPLDLVLRPGVTLVARVTSARTGKPLPDAVLDSRWTDTDDGFRANERGEIVVPILTEEQWHIEVAAPGHARYISDLKLVAPKTTVDVSLEPGGQVSGRIVDENDQPLAGARVSIGVEGVSMYRLDQADTNADGEYTLEYLPLNTPLSISASRKGYNYASLKTSVSDGRLASQDDVQLIPLADGGTVTGRVVDTAGKPITGARLTNIGNSTADERETTSDADGKFKIENLYVRHGDRVLVSIRADQFAPREIELSKEQRAGAEPLEVELQPGHRIRGRVVDEQGKPLRARVYFADGEHGFNGIGGRIDTDEGGRFESDSLPPGCTFSVWATGHSRLNAQSLPLDGEEEVVVRLEPVGVIRGQVVDAATGKPLKHFNVRIAFPAHNEPGDKKIGGITSTRINPGEDFSPVDGRFELGSLMNGCVLDVIVSADGYRRHTMERAMAAPAARAETPAIKLDRIGPNDMIRVAGKIVDEDGKPAAGVQVRLLGFDAAGSKPPFSWVALESDSLANNSSYGAYFKTVTNRRGEFSFDQVPDWLSLSLAYWSDRVPATRVDGLEKRLIGELANLTLAHVKPVTINVTFDPKSYPEAGSIAIYGRDFETFAYQSHELAAGDRGYAFAGLQAGNIRVVLYGKRLPREDSGSFTRKSLAIKRIDASPGDVVDVQF